MDSLAIGKCSTLIDLDNSNRGSVPSKMQIVNEEDIEFPYDFFPCFDSSDRDW